MSNHWTCGLWSKFLTFFHRRHFSSGHSFQSSLSAQNGCHSLVIIHPRKSSPRVPRKVKDLRKLIKATKLTHTSGHSHQGEAVRHSLGPAFYLKAPLCLIKTHKVWVTLVMLSRVRSARSNRNGIFFFFFLISQSDADSTAALTSCVFEHLIVCLLFSNLSFGDPVNSRESPEVRERGEKCIGLRTSQSGHICGKSSRYFRAFFLRRRLICRGPDGRQWTVWPRTALSALTQRSWADSHAR